MAAAEGERCAESGVLLPNCGCRTCNRRLWKEHNVDPREQMFSDVIITAVEGGTGYWAAATGYSYSEDDSFPASVTLTENDAHSARLHRSYPLTIHGIAAAMYRIVYDPTVNVNSRIKGSVTTALMMPAHADLDTDDADAIVQVLIFGDIVYG